MSLTLDLSPGCNAVPTLKVHGDIDIYSGNTLAQALHRLTQSNRRIALDLSDADVLDEDGVAVLVQAHEELRKMRGGLVVTAASRAVRRTLSFLGLDFLLRAY